MDFQLSVCIHIHVCVYDFCICIFCVSICTYIYMYMSLYVNTHTSTCACVSATCTHAMPKPDLSFTLEVFGDWGQGEVVHRQMIFLANARPSMMYKGSCIVRDSLAAPTVKSSRRHLLKLNCIFAPGSDSLARMIRTLEQICHRGCGLDCPQGVLGAL